MPLGDGSFVMKELPGPQNPTTVVGLLESVQDSMHLLGHRRIGFTATL